MKSTFFKSFAVAAAVAASMLVGAAAQAQQQNSILTSQIPLTGAGNGKTFDAATTRYISFNSQDPYIIDADGIRVDGAFAMQKLLNMPAWKGYISVTPYLFLNTVGARFSCGPATNYATVINFAGHGSESRPDNCALHNKVISQSNTQQ